MSCSVSSSSPSFSGARTLRFDTAEGERLKALGNELYQRGKYAEALKKFTEGARKDPTNPLIYANRAAVHLAMKNHIDAVFDAERATNINPDYAKAWARLGTALYALSSWDECSNAWQKALECLSKPGLNPADLTLRKQVEEGLNLAKAGSAKNAETAKLAPSLQLASLIASANPVTAPWARAEALKEEIRQDFSRESSGGKEVMPSCAFSLTNANDVSPFARSTSYCSIGLQCFKEAMRLLDILSHVHADSAGRGMLTMGSEGSFFENLTNAILIDERVFCTLDSRKLYGAISKHYQLESIAFESLVEGGGVELTKQEILKRLKEKGWESVRPAISVTIRYWIFQAYWRSYIYGPTFFSYHLYNRVIEFIRWGRAQWPNSPPSERGSSFQEEVLRGVMRLRLQLMITMFDSKYPDEVEHIFKIDDLAAGGSELSAAVDAHQMPDPSEGYPLGYTIAFWSSPLMHAHSALGFAFLSVAKAGWIDERHRDRTQHCFTRATIHYTNAAMLCPPDDANHALLLRKQLECLCHQYRPLSETLPVCSRIQKAALKALEIWTPPHEGGTALINNAAQVKQFQEWCEKEVKEGRMTMDKVQEKFIIPVGAVYDNIDQVSNPFQPFLWRKDREGGTDRIIPIEPMHPSSLVGEPGPSSRAKN